MCVGGRYLTMHMQKSEDTQATHQDCLKTKQL